MAGELWEKFDKMLVQVGITDPKDRGAVTRAFFNQRAGLNGVEDVRIKILLDGTEAIINLAKTVRLMRRILPAHPIETN